jgi:uncharacterized protein (TIGR03083 family)
MITIESAARITRNNGAADHAQAAYDRLLALLEKLEPDDWSQVTECRPWTVADMVGHVIGAARAGASVREQVRQQAWGMRHRKDHDGNALDAVNALQIADHEDLTPGSRVATLRELAPAAVRGRMRVPGPMRRVNLALDMTGSTAAGMPDRLRLGHLVDVIYTRDTWLHRIDIARATGQDPNVTATVDGPIVADVVAEWAQRHGQPFELVLTGPAGGEFRQGTGGERIEMDAVEYCRALSGRAPGDGLLGTRVLF